MCGIYICIYIFIFMLCLCCCCCWRVKLAWHSASHLVSWTSEMVTIFATVVVIFSLRTVGQTADHDEHCVCGTQIQRAYFNSSINANLPPKESSSSRVRVWIWIWIRIGYRLSVNCKTIRIIKQWFVCVCVGVTKCLSPSLGSVGPWDKVNWGVVVSDSFLYLFTTSC